MIIARRFQIGDEKAICEVIKKDILSENINDYTKEQISNLIESQNEKMVLKRAEKFHVYTFLDNEKIIGVGMIGPYWGSTTESSFFTIFRDPDYKGQGLGRKIIETLEDDELYTNAQRVEIPASLTAVEFYKHMGYGFKRTDEVIGYIANEEGQYKMEKYPQTHQSNCNPNQYNMRPYIDNDYHKFKEFIYEIKKLSYKKYVENIWGLWNEEVQRELFEKFIDMIKEDAWIIELNGQPIGFYNGFTLEDNNYEIGNICILPEYQGKGIGTQVLKDMIELHKEQDIHIQYFKENPVGKLYKKIGFEENGETPYHYQMIMKNRIKRK